MFNSNSLEPFYRKKAAARIISAQENGESTAVYRWLLDETRKGTIPEYIIGKTKFVLVSEVTAFIQQSRKSGDPS